MLDLPALGKPTRPTSASSRSSSRRRRCCPGSPRSWKCATRLPADREALPRPPRPPLAATKRAPGVARSASRRPCSSRAMVPTGTGRIRSSPSAPLRLLPWPWVPLPARWCGWKWYSTKVATLGSATSNTSPPRPPSPPSGPPRGRYFSRWNEVTPSPPRPPDTSTVVSSMNTMVLGQRKWAGGARGRSSPARDRRLLALLDAGELAAADLVVEDAAGDLGEQRVVAAAADA